MQKAMSLHTVRYQISLHYLGEGYVRRDEQRYRCRFELKEDGAESLESLPHVIPNVVSGTEPPDPAAVEAAMPGSESVNPPADTVYRLVITDNHTLPEVDAGLLGNTGSPNGDRTSRPVYYRKSNRRWMRDVRPLVPFRIIIRRFDGVPGNEERVDLDAGVRVGIEIKDPAEEKGMHAESDRNAVKNCLGDFFRKYSRSGNDPSGGDDNCPEPFAGHRTISDPSPGINAGKVVRKIPYVPSPTPDTALPGGIRPGRVSTEGIYASNHVTFDPELIQTMEDGSKVKIGVVDYVFSPLPIGGDNYRFLIRLVDGSGRDIRETRIDGAAVGLTDDRGEILPLLRAYCTGRFVIWRRIDVRLMLAANRACPEDIDWEKIRGFYRHAFMEISGPLEIRELPLTGWRQSIIDVFNGGESSGEYGDLDNFRPAGAGPEDVNYNDIYSQGLFPSFMNPASRTNQEVENLCSDILTKAVQALPPLKGGYATPESRNVDGEGEGFYMLYVKNNTGAAPGGMWLGDGRLAVSKLTGALSGMESGMTAHEMGHGLFLRNSISPGLKRLDPDTGGSADFLVRYRKAGDPDFEVIRLLHPTRNTYPEDHDQHFSHKCVMADLDRQAFCGICSLGLRFYDRIRIQDKGQYLSRIMEGSFVDVENPDNGAKIVHALYDPSAPDEIKLSEVIPAMAANQEIYLMAVGPEREYSFAGTPEKGRVNLGASGKDPISDWSSSNTGIVSLKMAGGIGVIATAKRPGTATIKFSRYGKSVAAVITVA
jgi:hypothetical protein